MKRFYLLLNALISVFVVKANVIPSSYYSTVGEGTYYIYDVTDQTFVGRETNRITFESSPTKTFTLASGENSGYTIKYDLTSTYMVYNHAGQGQSWGSDFWMDANGIKGEGEKDQYAAWNFTDVNSKTYTISTTYSYTSTTNNTGGTAKYLQGGVWSTETAASAHEYALITEVNYYKYLAEHVTAIPSSYYSEPAAGTFYIYNIAEGKFLMTAGISENNKALQTTPQVVTLTSNGDGTYKFSGNAGCYVKIGHFGGMWLWPNGTDTNVLSWTFNAVGSKIYKISATTTSAVTENGATKEAGTYYIINESNIGNKDDAANAGVYALISATDYPEWQNSKKLLTEVTGYSAETDIDNMNVSVLKSMTANVWNTLVVPFNMAIPSDWTVKEPKAFDGSTLTFVDASSIVAGKPYIVKPTSDVTSFSASGVTLYKDLQDTNVSDGALTMTGTYTLVDALPFGSYVVGIKDGTSALYRVNSTVSCAPFRAYFVLPAESLVKGNVLNIIFEGAETAISAVESLDKDSGLAYNLAGQRVTSLKKGLYIIGGKKVIIK